jgi:putative glycosyltransferase
MKISVVSTLYQSERTLQRFYKLVSKEIKKITAKDYEIIFVNDGSPDSSFAIAKKIAARDHHLSVIELSRNFGHHQAIMTGLSVAQGELVFLIDSDLEEEPGWLSIFHKILTKEKCDVVYGVAKERKGTLFEKITGFIFYRVFRIITGLDQPNNICTARLMKRKYVKALLMHSEKEINFGGLCLITGFHQFAEPVEKNNSSPTSYSLAKKMSHTINAITSFSNKPLIFIFYAGAMLSTTAVGYITYLLYRYFFIATPPDGYMSIVASIWLFSGLIIFFNGIQGIYLSKVYLESKSRPLSIIRSITKRRKK